MRKSHSNGGLKVLILIVAVGFIGSYGGSLECSSASRRQELEAMLEGEGGGNGARRRTLVEMVEVKVRKEVEVKEGRKMSVGCDRVEETLEEETLIRE